MRTQWNHYLRGVYLGKAEIADGKLNYHAQRDTELIFNLFRHWNDYLVPLMQNTVVHENKNFERLDWREWADDETEGWEIISDVNTCLNCIIMDGQIIAFFINNGMGTSYLILDGMELFTPLKVWNNLEHYEEGESFEVRVPMRDSVTLHTEVLLPKRKIYGEKFPVIISRTPYGIGRIREYERAWIHYGFAVVLQDVRGRETSDGVFIAMFAERRDGADTLDWIVSQPWSNGEVGSIGGSYGGYVQWTMAASGHSALKAIVSMVTSGSPFQDVERLGGGYNMEIMNWNLMMSEKKPLFNLDPVTWNIPYQPIPLRDVPEEVGGRKIPFWNEYTRHPHYDAFWRELTFSAWADDFDIPALVITGWHDGDLKGSTEVWEMNRIRGRKNQRLVIGPWTHHFNASRHLGENDYGTNGTRINIDRLYLAWFECFLKHKKNGVERTKVEIFVEGANRWLTLPQFPPCSNIPFYLGKDKNLTTAPCSNGTSTYTYDPTDPAPQLLDVKSGKRFVPLDYTEVEKRGDVLTFTTAPVKKQTVLAGRPKAKLYISSTAIDTDFVVRLTKVTGGMSVRFAEGYARCRYRESFEKEVMMIPGQIYVIEMDMPYCGVSLEPGDALRAEVTSAQFGEMFPNTNTGKDPLADNKSIKATQTIWFGTQYPSCVYIPIYKGGEM